MINRSEFASPSGNGIMGLSGLDTSSMLEKMMSAYRTPITVTKQRQQLVIWKQEAYRNLIGKIHDFKAKFFSYSSPATNMLALGNYRKFNVNNPGSEFANISSTGTTEAGRHTLEVQKMPVSATLTGASGITKPMMGSGHPVWTDAHGYYLSLNMDGIVRHIEITPDIDTTEELQTAIDKAFGVGNIIVTGGAGGGIIDPLVFTAGEGVNQISIFDGTNMSARLAFQFNSESNTSNRVTLDSSLSALKFRLNTPITFVQTPTWEFDASNNQIMKDVVRFSINGKEFEFDSSTSLRTVIDTINRDETAGVTIKYDNAADAFTITAKLGGPGDTINIKEEETGFFAALGLQVQQPAAGLTTEIAGLDFDPAALIDINDAITAGEPLAFSININGLVETIILDGYPTSGTLYTDLYDIADHINDQIQAQFGDRGLTAYSDGARIFFVIASEDASSNPYPDPIKQLSFGSASGQTVEQGDETLAALGLGSMSRSVIGSFGRIVVDGETLAIDRTEFIHNGVSYELYDVTPAGKPIVFSMETDTDSIVNLIREFVDAYNEIVLLLDTALSEKRDKDNSYPPLTDAQKEQMTEKEIEKWEEKAKMGLLRSDVNLIGLNSKMRLIIHNRVYNSTDSDDFLKLNLSSIGISTTSYQDKGVLSINEDILVEALKNDLGAVARLFAQAPLEHERTYENQDMPEEWHAKQEKWLKENTGGIVYKLLDLIEDYARVTRNEQGIKGRLIEHSGIINDVTDVTSTLSRQIAAYDEKLSKLWDRYDMMEKRFISMLARLESSITTMSAQNEWLTQQINNSGNS
ncbi:MAG: flagellar filament capping protein FliD [Oscillospiraceae bacterium]|nr:flagellar filament capping protein FliD [Oscillospiraceae bacterium]